MKNSRSVVRAVEPRFLCCKCRAEVREPIEGGGGEVDVSHWIGLLLLMNHIAGEVDADGKEKHIPLQSRVFTAQIKPVVAEAEADTYVG